MNVAEEAVAEELLPYKELFTSVVPGQDHKTAATSLILKHLQRHQTLPPTGQSQLQR